MPKFKKFKCYILSNFHTMCRLLTIFIILSSRAAMEDDLDEAASLVEMEDVETLLVKHKRNMPR